VDTRSSCRTANRGELFVFVEGNKSAPFSIDGSQIESKQLDQFVIEIAK